MSEPYPAAVPVRGATIPAPPEPGGPGPAADEAAVVHILRILHRVRDAGTLAPIDRAFVLAARAMFAELGNVCDALLSRPPEPAGPPRRPALPVIGGEGPTPAPPAADAPPAPDPAPRRRRPIARGGSGLA